MVTRCTAGSLKAGIVITAAITILAVAITAIAVATLFTPLAPFTALLAGKAIIVAISCGSIGIVSLVALIILSIKKGMQGSHATGGLGSTATPGYNPLKDGCYVRFIGVGNGIAWGINNERDNHANGYTSPSCYYSDSTFFQPLSVDVTGKNQLNLMPTDGYFGVIIKTNMDPDYFSLTDIDSTSNREALKNATGTKTRLTNYLLPPKSCKITHKGRGSDHMFEKLNTIKAAGATGTYLTGKGKAKDVADIYNYHHEAGIKYDPDQDVVGFVILNTAAEIQKAQDYVANEPNFAHVKLYYQDTVSGKLIEI